MTPIVTSLLVLFFLFWAMTLANRVPSANDRVIHLLAALVFGPLYIIAYYASHWRFTCRV